MQDYLSDSEQQKIASFMRDTKMVDAVKKVILAGIYFNGTLKPDVKANPLKNFALSLAFDPKIDNEALGADLRATAQGISFVEKGFGELGKIAELASVPKAKKEKNPAL